MTSIINLTHKISFFLENNIHKKSKYNKGRNPTYKIKLARNNADRIQYNWKWTKTPSNRKAAGERGGLKAVVCLRGVLIGLLETKMTTAGASKLNLFGATNPSALIVVGPEP